MSWVLEIREKFYYLTNGVYGWNAVNNDFFNQRKDEPNALLPRRQRDQFFLCWSVAKSTFDLFGYTFLARYSGLTRSLLLGVMLIKILQDGKPNPKMQDKWDFTLFFGHRYQEGIMVVSVGCMRGFTESAWGIYGKIFNFTIGTLATLNRLYGTGFTPKLRASSFTNEPHKGLFASIKGVFNRTPKHDIKKGEPHPDPTYGKVIDLFFKFV